MTIFVSHLAHRFMLSLLLYSNLLTPLCPNVRSQDGALQFIFPHVSVGAWRVYEDKRCHLGDGEPNRLTLKDCKKACGAGCSFFLYHAYSPYKENCWVGNETQSMAKTCYNEKGGWKVYVRKNVEWKSVPNTRCTLGDGVANKQTLEQCKRLCPEDKCPFFLYHHHSPYSENCWIAKQSTTFKEVCSSKPGSGFTVYHHAWIPVHDTKCRFGDGYDTKISLDACKALCPEADCPFFLYHPKSPYNENCWIGSSDNDISRDCCVGKKCLSSEGSPAGFTLYMHKSASHTRVHYR